MERDLARQTFSPITSDWIAATRVPASEWTDHQRETIAASEILIAELMAADIVLIGTPMHNFSVSWPLKAWIDPIVRVGKTVIYDRTGPRGGLQGKQVIVISSRGGSYRPGSPRAQLDFLEPYLRAVLGFIGLKGITFIQAENQYHTDQAPEGKAAASQQVGRAVLELATSCAIPIS